MKLKIVKGEFKDTGINEIDIDLVVSKWNHLWAVVEWTTDNSWRLVKYTRKDYGTPELKTTISRKQAKELIKKLNLKRTKTVFRSGFTWSL